MKHVANVAGRELRGLFVSPVAYGVLSLFSVLAGLFFIVTLAAFNEWIFRLQQFQAFDQLYETPPVRKLYIVKNGKFHPEYKPVQEQTIPIAARAIRTLIKSQNRGEIYRIYRMAKDAGVDFNLVFIPVGFAASAKEAFDPQYQAALFAEGYRLAASGKGWLKAPPEGVPARR